MDWSWWQQLPYHIDPVLLRLGPLSVRYYGLCFLSAIIAAYLLSRHRALHEKTPYNPRTVEDYFVYAAFGVVAGGRLGYVLFYDPVYYLTRPWEIILPLRLDDGVEFTGIGGMSYHGGLLGVILATWIFCRRRNYSFWHLVDFIIPAVPAGYTLGRIGNFLNGELFGRPTSVPWGMIFPADPFARLRHPSQLYEALGEGLFLFAVLWLLRRRSPFSGFLFSLYLIGYGTIRFFIEFTRAPDPHLGLVLGPFSMGQVLCLAMILAGAGFMTWRAAVTGAGSARGAGAMENRTERT